MMNLRIERSPNQPFSVVHVLHSRTESDVIPNGFCYEWRSLQRTFPIKKQFLKKEKALATLFAYSIQLWVNFFCFFTKNAIKFVIKLPEEELKKLSDEDIIKKFKLSANISVNNLVLFNPQFNIKRYNNECEVLEEFYHVRYKYYQMRKASLLKKMNQDYDKFNN